MGDPILIWGAGAIGGTAGGWLKRGGHDVTFVDVVADHVAAIRDASRSLWIRGPVDAFGVTAPAFMPNDVAGSFSRIFRALKAQHTEEATEALRPLKARNRVVSTASILRRSALAPVPHRLGPAWRRWRRCIAAVPRRIRVSGATYGCAGAARRSMCRLAPSPNMVLGTELIAAQRGG